jgi:hypothetical protein
MKKGKYLIVVLLLLSTVTFGQQLSYHIDWRIYSTGTSSNIENLDVSFQNNQGLNNNIITPFSGDIGISPSDAVKFGTIYNVTPDALYKFKFNNGRRCCGDFFGCYCWAYVLNQFKERNVSFANLDEVVLTSAYLVHNNGQDLHLGFNYKLIPDNEESRLYALAIASNKYKISSAFYYNMITDPTAGYTLTSSVNLANHNILSVAPINLHSNSISGPITNTTFINPDIILNQQQLENYQHISVDVRLNKWGDAYGNQMRTTDVQRTQDYAPYVFNCHWSRDALKLNFMRNVNFTQFLYCDHNDVGESNCGTNDVNFYRTGYEFFRYVVTPYIKNLSTLNPVNSIYCEKDTVKLVAPIGFSPTVYNWQYSINGSPFLDIPQVFTFQKINIAVNTLPNYTFGSDVSIRLKTYFNGEYSDTISSFRFIPVPPTLTPIVVPAQCASNAGGISYSDVVTLSNILLPGEKIVMNGRDGNCSSSNSNGTCFSATGGDLVIIDSFRIGTTNDYHFKKANRYHDGVPLYDSIILASNTSVILYYLADLNGSGYNYNPSSGGGAQAIIDQVRTCAVQPVAPLYGTFPPAPKMLLSEIIITNIDCWGTSTGAIDISNAYQTLTGNPASWEPTNYFISKTTGTPYDANNPTGIFNGLQDGIYNVWFTTANNCKSDTLKTAINSPTYGALDIGSNFNPKEEISSVNLNDGYLSLNIPSPQNGWGNWVYQWKKNNTEIIGETTNSISNLSEGDYKIIAKDHNGISPFCSKELSYTLLKPLPLKIDTIRVIKNPNCYETNEGIIKVNFHGGMPRDTPNNQFSYKIFDRVTGTLVKENSIGVIYTNYQSSKKDSVEINSLYKGLYKLVLNYKNIEYDSANFTIAAPDSIKAVVTELIYANGAGEGGSVKINVTGGTDSYRYKWVDSSEILMPNDSSIIRRNPMLSNDNNSNLLIPNTNPAVYSPYTIEIKNSNIILGCKAFTINNIYINRDRPVIAITQLKYAHPNMSDGAIAVNVTRGKQPYVNIKWVRIGSVDTITHIFSHADTLSNIPFGNYYVEVQDASGFIVNTFIYLPLVINGSITQIQPIRCFNNHEAQLQVLPSGGDSTRAPIYRFQWLDSLQQIIPGQQANGISLLPAGKYFVKITDQRDSSFIAGPYTVTQPPLFRITGETIQSPTCNNANNGFIKVDFTGGTAPYQFKWNGVTADSAVIRNIGIGQYTIRIKDSLGCPVAPSGEISKSYTITPQSDLRILDSLTVITTPTTDISADGNVALTIKDYKHSSGYTLNYTWKNNAGNTVAQGIAAPNNNGLVNINLANQPSGEYFLHTNSSNGCMLDRNYVLIGPNQIIVKIYPNGIDSVKCYQKEDAKIKPVIYKGSNVGSLNIKWTKLVNTAQQFITTDTLLNHIGAGNYTITVKGFSTALPDSITATANAILYDQAKIMVQFTATINEHCDKKDGVIFSDTYGGRSNGPYRYTWTRLTGREGYALIDSNKAILNTLSEGTYRLYAIENAYGCKDSNEVVVKNTFIDIVTNFVKPICANGADGKIQVIPTGGKEPGDFYFYKLAKLNATTNLYDTIQNKYSLNNIWFTNLSRGKYKIVVTTKYGCKQIADVDMPDPPTYSINIGDDKTLCVGALHFMNPIFTSSDGTIVDTSGWKYQWYHFPDNINNIFNAYSLNQYLIVGAQKPTLQINEVELINGKRYLLKATTNNQCVVLDSIKFERSNQKLLASFLVTEHAFTNESIVAVNTSSIAPYYQWILPPGCDVVPNFTNDTSYITFKFAQPGVYPIKFRAYYKNTSGTITCETLLLSNITVTQPLVSSANTTRLPSMYKIGYPKIIPNPIVGNQLNVTAQVYFTEKARVYIVEMGTSYKINLPDWYLVKGITNTYMQPIPGVLPSKQYALVIETPKERKVLPFLKL